MIQTVLLWGTVAGAIHFVVLGMLYGNPVIDRMYVDAAKHNGAVRAWPSKPRYLVTQLMGTQVEVYILAVAFFVLRSHWSPGFAGALSLGLLLAAVRVYPRFWNMWIQTVYPRRLLGVEIINGTLGTLAIIAVLEFFTGA